MWIGFRDFGATIGVAVNSVLLFFVYIIAVGPVALIGRMFGKKFLDTEFSKEKESYWIPVDIGSRAKEEYYRQF